MKSIRVPLKDRSYDIYIGSLKSEFFSVLRRLVDSRSMAFVVTSQALKKAAHFGVLMAGLKKAGLSASAVILPDGESQKNLKTLSLLYRRALQAGLDRKSTVIALGGGVITDLAGFFAATYMRGISLISVPTTLLGMVDASIGGKTGVDLAEGKNLVGAFWQPRMVWIDPAVLKTLPEREWRTGFAEVVKYGVIKDRPFFQWLEQRVRRNPRVSHWPPRDLLRMIYVSAKTKADVVGKDERETPLKGGREILNFGHTVGHALEAATGYKSMSHGEAISIGMVVAGRLARSLGFWSDDEQLRLALLLQTVGLPIHVPKLSSAQTALFWAALIKDKKHIAGQLRFVLPVRIGRVEVRSKIPVALVKKSFS